MTKPIANVLPTATIVDIPLPETTIVSIHCFNQLAIKSQFQLQIQLHSPSLCLTQCSLMLNRVTFVKFLSDNVVEC